MPSHEDIILHGPYFVLAEPNRMIIYDALTGIDMALYKKPSAPVDQYEDFRVRNECKRLNEVWHKKNG